jgi:predicted flap endonuclease-1-like 5' DNA nuclease
MLHYFIELAVAALIAYLLGCCVGCLLRKWFGVEEPIVEAPRAPVVKPVVTAGAAAVTAAAATAAAAKIAEPRSVTPAPVVAPVPVAPRPVAVAPVAPRPAPAPVAAPLYDPHRPVRPMGLSAARGGKGDDLLRISGVGPKNQEILHSLGIYHFDHMKFNGRVAREEWINQARLLANGNEAEFARLYGTGGEGAKEAGLRTVRGPRESEAQTIVSPPAPAADGGVSGGGKMQRPKGITAARGGKADNLQRISGIGPKNEKILQGLGFFHFDQIAAWTKSEIDWVEDHLRFGGRIAREEWTKQARLLADGKDAEFTKLYGTGGLTNKKGETLSGSRTRKS